MTREDHGVRVRPLAEGDLTRVAELEPVLFGPAAWAPAVYAEELRTPGRAYVAAAAPDGTVVGYGGVALAEDAEVMTVGVDPQWRGRGVGAALLDALVAAARGARARRVYLEVRAEDAAARRLYRRAGFRRVGLRRGYYQPENADAVVMRLDLAVVGPVGSDATGSDATGSDATGSDATGSDATGSDATGSDATGARSDEQP